MAKFGMVFGRVITAVTPSLSWRGCPISDRWPRVDFRPATHAGPGAAYRFFAHESPLRLCLSGGSSQLVAPPQRRTRNFNPGRSLNAHFVRTGEDSVRPPATGLHNFWLLLDISAAPWCVSCGTKWPDVPTVINFSCGPGNGCTRTSWWSCTSEPPARSALRTPMGLHTGRFFAKLAR